MFGSDKVTMGVENVIPKKQVETHFPFRHSRLSRWLHDHGLDIERQLFIVQWALPFLLAGIVFIYETNEHLFTKHEALSSYNFLGENFFFGVLGPTAVWIVLWWVRREWRERERDKQTLHAMYNELAAAQARLNVLHAQRGELLNRLMSVQEEERRRLAREIHDELGQLLTGLSLNLKLCQEAVPPDLKTAHEYLARASTLVRDSIEQSHRIIADLRPTVLDDLGLVAAIQDEVHRWPRSLGLAVQLHVEGLDKRLPPAVETAVFRIVQEALSNVVRHAHANHVWITLRRSGGRLHVVVEDDGIGVPQNIERSVDGHPPFGILGMRERAAVLGGSLKVEPRHPCGTRVALDVPLMETET